MTQLTDEEIGRCLVEANRLPGFQSGIDIARAVIAAHEAKQRAEAVPEAWGLLAKVSGEWVLQHPVRFSQSDAKSDCGQYVAGTELYVSPLYTHPSEDARDAARYRWLRAERFGMVGNELDAAIDSAIAEGAAK